MQAVKQIKKLIFLLATFFLQINLAFGDGTIKPLIWEVNNDKNNTLHRLYLMGSIHFGDQSMYPLPATIMEKFNSSNQLAVELDITRIDPTQIQIIFAKLGTYSKGKQDLRSSIANKTWEQLEHVSSQMGGSAESFNAMKPWLVAMQLITNQLIVSGYQEAYGIDRFFLAEATMAKKRIIELETMESQLNLLASFSSEEQEAFLAQSLTDFSSSPKMLHQLFEAWKSGDEQFIEELLLRGAMGFGLGMENMYQQIIVDRNNVMTRRAEELLQQPGESFFLVGLGHLVGNKGIVAQLKSKGYILNKL